MTSLRHMMTGLALVGTLLAPPVGHTGNLEQASVDALLSDLNKAEPQVDKGSPCQVAPPPGPFYRGTRICNDLYEATCAPGQYDDGTGLAVTSGAITAKLKELREWAGTEAFSQVRKALSGPGNSSLRKVVFSAFKAKARPACRGVVTEACVSEISKSASGFLLKRVLAEEATGSPVSDESPRAFSPGLREIDVLLENRAYAKLERKFLESVEARLQRTDLTAKIEKEVYPEIQRVLLGKIAASVSDPEQQKLLIEKIRAVKFGGSDCALPEVASIVGPDAPLIAPTLLPSGFYVPDRKTFIYCNGLLMANASEFQMAAVIAHELSHSFDPCLITQPVGDLRFRYSDPNSTAKSDQEFPFPGLLSCLRGSKSTAARAPAPVAKAQPIAVTGNVKSKQPPRADDFPVYCEGDQITEAFADWVAAEVLHDYIKQKHPHLSQEQLRIGYSNVYRGTCNNSDLDDEVGRSRHHPQHERRVNRILLVHPGIRKQMGCSKDLGSESIYCSGSARIEK